MTDKLLEEAAKVRSHAHVPYSKFAVGAAILGRSGRIYTGCNIENISLGLTMCAERVAVGNAVSNGESDFVAIAVVTDSKELAWPCGACRQVLAEFNPKLEITTVSGSTQRETTLLSELLPRAKQGIEIKRPG